MKDWKTTIFGGMLAALVALQPILDGSGYHFDKQTISKLIFAGLVGLATFYAKDKDAEA